MLQRSGETEVRIGTSGWHYDHWRGPFYPEGFPSSKMLPFYFERFDTVEINNTFYQLPPESSFLSWRRNTPKDFLFAVKGSRFLTHMKKLKEPEEGLARFLERAELLREKLGPILFQLPPRWKSNPERLESFIELLPKKHRYAFELRDPSWLNEEVYAVLRRHNCAYCIYELRGFVSPLVITADFTYVRLHGPLVHAYAGSYSPEALRMWAGRIDEWKRKLQAIYFYFDNDQGAYAVNNALDLKKLAAAGEPARIASAATGGR